MAEVFNNVNWKSIWSRYEDILEHFRVEYLINQTSGTE